MGTCIDIDGFAVKAKFVDDQTVVGIVIGRVANDDVVWAAAELIQIDNFNTIYVRQISCLVSAVEIDIDPVSCTGTAVKIVIGIGLVAVNIEGHRAGRSAEVESVVAAVGEDIQVIVELAVALDIVVQAGTCDLKRTRRIGLIRFGAQTHVQCNTCFGINVFDVFHHRKAVVDELATGQCHTVKACTTIIFRG